MLHIFLTKLRSKMVNLEPFWTKNWKNNKKLLKFSLVATKIQYINFRV